MKSPKRPNPKSWEVYERDGKQRTVLVVFREGHSDCVFYEQNERLRRCYLTTWRTWQSKATFVGVSKTADID